MTLYDYPGCPFGKKVRIVLAEKELSFDTVIVDLAKGQQRGEEFRRLNPFGKVPVLVDEGSVVYESTIINEYLNDEYPHDPELLPEDSGERARVRLLVDFADRAFTLPSMAIERELAAAERDESKLSMAREAVTKCLTVLERELAGKEFLSEQFSLADVAFAPTLVQLDRLGIVVDGSLPSVQAWRGRLTSRPSIGNLLKLVA
ncbi:MAG TPA: glutathione S-transferase family protein [Candidatus Limnocylindrales bacterium]|nr:glutathione S-transferase family protein [Candidatus Limnocylindrales bacterium]